MSVIVISSWHKNKDENKAMLRLYTYNGNNIAIKSTVGKVLDSIKTQKNIRVRDVNYVNFEESEEKFNSRELLEPIFKRMNFQFEDEVRFFYGLDFSNSEINDMKLNGKKIRGQPVEVDPSVLIEEIYISPYAPVTYQQ